MNSPPLPLYFHLKQTERKAKKSIDREEENGNTINVIKRAEIENVTEVDSKDSIGVRISNMLVGLISNLLKTLNTLFKYLQT